MSRNSQTKTNPFAMYIAAHFQMSIVTDVRVLFAFLRVHGLAWTRRSNRSRRIPEPQRHRTLLEPCSLFTLRSPDDQLHVVAFRLNQHRAPEEGIKNE
jgi:hypothetical protein